MKNTSAQKRSWGNLIKNYNFNAKGNVEQFSICSGDSIWGNNHEIESSLDSLSINQNSDTEAQDLTSKINDEMHFDDQNFKAMAAHGQNMNASTFFHHHHHPQDSQLANFFARQAQCFQQQQQQQAHEMQTSDCQKQYFSNSNKFKNHIMEKYIFETNNNGESINGQQENLKKPELSKWLESTANFQPSKNNYNIDFVKAERKKKQSKSTSSSNGSSLCEKELIAAETLVLLKNFRTTKFYNS